MILQIKSPFKNKHGDRETLITLWHKDPCKDGTDDSCGWFKRERHGDQKVLKQIRKEFYSEYKFLFNEDGTPKMSVIATVIQLYGLACWAHFKRNRRKKRAFMKKYLFDIIQFAENPFDSLRESIVNKTDKEEYFCNHLASVIYGDILRKNSKWYEHPRWHVHHWKIDLNFAKNFYKKYFGLKRELKDIEEGDAAC